MSSLGSHCWCGEISATRVASRAGRALGARRVLLRLSGYLFGALEVCVDVCLVFAVETWRWSVGLGVLGGSRERRLWDGGLVRVEGVGQVDFGSVGGRKPHTSQSDAWKEAVPPRRHSLRTSTDGTCHCSDQH